MVDCDHDRYAVTGQGKEPNEGSNELIRPVDQEWMECIGAMPSVNHLFQCRPYVSAHLRRSLRYGTGRSGS